MLNCIKRELRRGQQDIKGNVAITFTLCLLPMIAFVGVGVDFSRGLAAKTALDAAADAAALAAATEAMALMNQFSGQSYATSTAQTYGVYTGQQMFTTNSAKLVSQLTATPSPNISVTPPTGGVITASVSYQVKIKNVFGAMLGMPTSSISGSSASTLKMPTYMNISVAVDVSQSMGLASTSSGMSQLQSLTPDACAFGCHVVAAAQSNSSSYYQKTPYEQIAHTANPPIQLRIDVISQAAQNMITTAQTSNPGLISFGIYTIQNGLQTLYSPPSSPSQSSDYSAAKTAAAKIDLDSTTTAPGLGDSYYDTSVSSLTSTVPASGDGTTYAKKVQYAFIMTDGVQDEVALVDKNHNQYCATTGSQTPTGPWGGHCTQPFDPAQCAAMKNANITVGVIYTTYLAMPTEGSYQALVQPFSGQIASNLQQCASSGWFYQASDADGINRAMAALFAKATGSGVLTK